MHKKEHKYAHSHAHHAGHEQYSPPSHQVHAAMAVAPAPSRGHMWFAAILFAIVTTLVLWQFFCLLQTHYAFCKGQNDRARKYFSCYYMITWAFILLSLFSFILYKTGLKRDYQLAAGLGAWNLRLHKTPEIDLEMLRHMEMDRHLKEQKEAKKKMMKHKIEDDESDEECSTSSSSSSSCSSSSSDSEDSMEQQRQC